ncbi:MAG: HEAT repeat domain-containing protein [Planctomycetota bacterium]
MSWWLARAKLARYIVRNAGCRGLPPRPRGAEEGRESGDVRVPDGGASREHAEIVRRGDELFIRDLGSRNGTLLNKRRIDGEARLAFGDRVRIANTIYELVADESDVAKALAAPAGETAAAGDDSKAEAGDGAAAETPVPGPEAAAGSLETLRSLHPRARRVIGVGVLVLLVGAVSAGVLIGRRKQGPDEAERPETEETPSPVVAEVPKVPSAPARAQANEGAAAPVDTTGADATGTDAAGADEGGRSGWYSVLTGRAVDVVSSVAEAEGEEADLRAMAERLLADAGDTSPAGFVEPDVDERAFVPAEEPEGDIDFEAEEAAAKAEAEKGAGEGGAATAAPRSKTVTTASGRKIDADVFLAPLPRTLRRRLTPKHRTPMTDADRIQVSRALESLRMTKSTSRFSANSYNRITKLKGLARYDDPSVSRSLVFLARDRDPGVRRALADVLAAHDNLESVKTLLALISQRDAVLGVSAAASLASLSDEKTVEWLYTSALTRGTSGTVRGAVAEALGQIGEERAIPQLVKSLGDSRAEARAGAAIALGRFRHGGAVEGLVKLTRDRDPKARVAALLALGSIRNPATAPDVIKCLKDREPSVRSAAARALGALRVAESVGPLVEALAKEPSRVKDDLIRALTLTTALRHEDNMLAWKSLVREKGDRLIVAELALAASVLDEIEAGNVEYYGIRTRSTRICFLVDISGSMQGQKLADAKGELQQAIGRFTVKHFFNMIFFSTTVRSWRRRLTQATDVVLARAKAHIYEQNAAGGTNIFDAVMLALKDPLVDTIFLLSDGAPTSGSVTEPDAIRAAVLKANTRGVVIHCIGIGFHDREFMAGLARDNNGKYVVPEERVK